MPQLLFGGFLATVLLAFYIWSIFDAVGIAMACQAGVNCSDQFTPNMSFLLNSLGGLIAATVVGVLGATQPGEFPSKKLFEKNLTGTTQTIAAYMPSVYIVVWIVCGVIMVIYGFILHPDAVQPLSAQAKVWIGTAIASVYAYFGIKPEAIRPSIAHININPTSINLTAAAPTARLSAAATDAQNTPIPNLSNNRFQWESDNETVAKVDETGSVTRIGAGNCQIKARTNGQIVSNGCTVVCS